MFKRIYLTLSMNSGMNSSTKVLCRIGEAFPMHSQKVEARGKASLTETSFMVSGSLSMIPFKMALILSKPPFLPKVLRNTMARSDLHIFR